MTLADAAAALRMDDIYRYQRFIYDATRRYFLLGRLELIEGLNPPAEGHVLEIGCGTAWNLVRAAHLYPSARLYGLDISTEMLRTAGRAIDRRRQRQRVSLACGDATAFDAHKMFGRKTFDRIFVSYALSMIPDWPHVLTACERMLAPNGEIHLIDFSQCERLPRLFRHILFAWLARFSVEPRADLEDHLVTFARDAGMEFDIMQLYCGYAVHAKLRRT